MQLKLFKTMWGFKGSYIDAVQSALEQGYDGIEGPVPASEQEAQQFAELLEQNKLCYIAEVATTGTYVPDRKLSPEVHLQYLHDKLKLLPSLKPLFITCLGGCDAWPETESILFFRKAMDMAGSFNCAISFETHRGRSLFNPWITLRIVEQIPDLKLTCDFSHWCVVCEGLQDTEEDIIRFLLPNVWHIHGRVGYDQGPQVPDPRTQLYTNDVNKHLKWWQWIRDAHFEQGRAMTTVTPEFGPDGYEYRDPHSGSPLIDIDEINIWIADVLRSQFAQTSNNTELCLKEHI